MRTIEKNIYTFEELSPEVQAVAIDHLRDINVGYDWWGYTFDYYKEKLESLGFINAKIDFSGFYSQGDGACFDADIDLITILENKLQCAADYKDAKNLLRWLVLEDNGLLADYKISSNGSRYSHERTRFVDTTSYASDCVKDWETDEILIMLEDLRLELCREIYSSLEIEYEYLISDEAVKGTIEANEYEFTENGCLY